VPLVYREHRRNGEPAEEEKLQAHGAQVLHVLIELQELVNASARDPRNHAQTMTTALLGG
jgi:hypothetical protein